MKEVNWSDKSLILKNTIQRRETLKNTIQRREQENSQNINFVMLFYSILTVMSSPVYFLRLLLMWFVVFRIPCWVHFPDTRVYHCQAYMRAWRAYIYWLCFQFNTWTTAKINTSKTINKVNIKCCKRKYSSSSVYPFGFISSAGTFTQSGQLQHQLITFLGSRINNNFLYWLSWTITILTLSYFHIHFKCYLKYIKAPKEC